jgi:hypothetical protein
MRAAKKPFTTADVKEAVEILKANPAVGEVDVVVEVPLEPFISLTVPVSTRRAPSWEPVAEGTPIGVPCEGGVVTERAPERGVEFKIDGAAPLFIPESMLDEVMQHLGRRHR